MIVAAAAATLLLVLLLLAIVALYVCAAHCGLRAMLVVFVGGGRRWGGHGGGGSSGESVRGDRGLPGDEGAYLEPIARPRPPQYSREPPFPVPAFGRGDPPPDYCEVAGPDHVSPPGYCEVAGPDHVYEEIAYAAPGPALGPVLPRDAAPLYERAQHYLAVRSRGAADSGEAFSPTPYMPATPRALNAEPSQR